MSTLTMTKAKPRLTFWQIWNMSFGFLGIQFGFALQNANTSRIFETLNAEVSSLAVYWLAAPLTGLIVQPIIGYYSDRTWHAKWGRRRPFFAVGAILASVALCLMPNSPALWMAVGMLWIMDASFNISMEPFRALVGDKLPADQRTRGFTMQSFFIGTGAIVASVLPWVFTNWFGFSNTADTGVIPVSVRYAYYVGAVVLSITVFWTVFSTVEYPPEDLDEFRKSKTTKRKIEKEDTFKKKFLRLGSLLVVIGAALSAVFYGFSLEKELFVLSMGLAAAGLLFLISYALVSRNRSHLDIVHITRDLTTMPQTMVQLAWVQFFSWFALFSMWIYTTSAVTSHVYGTTDAQSKIYNDAADFVGILFGGYNGIAAVAALLLPVVARSAGRRMTHLMALVCGGLGLISIYFVTDPMWLWMSMVGVGIAWASILSMPYAMLTGALPPDKMGYYMGIFNFFIVIPQIVAGTLLGFLLNKIFDGQPIYVLVAGGVSMIIAGLLSLRVNDVDEVPAQSI